MRKKFLSFVEVPTCPSDCWLFLEEKEMPEKLRFSVAMVAGCQVNGSAEEAGCWLVNERLREGGPDVEVEVDVEEEREPEFPEADVDILRPYGRSG